MPLYRPAEGGVGTAAMERIAAILIVFVLLMNGRHVERRLPESPQTIIVHAEPVALAPDDPARVTFGPLRYLGGWALTSRNDSFGGISSMFMRADGTLVTLSDTGEVVAFRPGSGDRVGRLFPVPAKPREMGAPKWLWDTESMTIDRRTGRVWVGFELTNRICRYSAGFARIDGCISPKAVRRWPQSTGMESLQRLPDGRFLAIAEQYEGPAGGNDVLLFAGDPLDPATPPPAHLGYRPPQGYLPTDTLWLGGGRLLVMNRRVTLLDGLTGIITLVHLGEGRPGEILKGESLGRFAAPLIHDNFEALALSFEQGRPVLWVASDDNHLFFQRSLLLKFALPPGWVK